MVPSRWAKLVGWEPQAGVQPAAALLVPAVLEATRNKASACYHSCQFTVWFSKGCS